MRSAPECSLANAQERNCELEVRGLSPSAYHLGLSTFSTEDLLRAQCARLQSRRRSAARMRARGARPEP